MKKFVKAMILCFVIFAIYPTTNAFAANTYVAGTDGEWKELETVGTCPSKIWVFNLYADNGNSIYNGWVKSGQDWYYISRRIMVDPGNKCINSTTNGWMVIDRGSAGERWYLFAPGGKLVQKSGWEQNAQGKWMYFIPGDYGLATNESLVIDGTKYYFDSNGYMK
ncbi:MULTISPECIES: hypothetical protein [Bacillus]|uniref:hypothetical protein n=1 Tax=Bacillus TaxID=1386 RepID=UPI0001A15421|nr:hypothetical protein [Bacillus pseudomycoides]EEM15782.1 hypothetical protein bpmyx0001_32520 [Bacillus pseudomycoides DSM 12442]MED1474524.1 hypothetical protein [Bacillus pseudomycoides]MED1597612.1 hypothetical protein [Bacillus pseudomycoides]MED4711695.1 hypothetical protein [Bacillus pseudomycoides]PDY11129.1 hypothetical protein COO16_16980 [Bacillus pseudomycoides]